MRNSEQHSEKGAAFWFLHRLSGAHELPQAGSPFPGGSFFQHRLSGGRELPQACSPLTGGEFFAEPQRGDSPSADGGNVPRPAAGAKRKDNLRFSFLFELLPFPCLIARRKSESGDRFEMGRTAEDFFYRVFLNRFAVSDSVLLHGRLNFRRRNMTVLRNPLVWSLRTAPTD